MKSAQGSDSFAVSETVTFEAARPALGLGEGRKYRGSDRLQCRKGLGHADLARLLRSIHTYVSLRIAHHELTHVVKCEHGRHTVGVIMEFVPALPFNLARADE